MKDRHQNWQRISNVMQKYQYYIQFNAGYELKHDRI